MVYNVPRSPYKRLAGARDPWTGDDEIVHFIESSLKVEKKAKPRPRGAYVPDEFTFDPSEEDTEWSHREIRTQIGDTVSTMDRKTLRSGDEIFFLLDLKYNPSYFEVRHILTRLNANVLAYLNETHNKMLVSASREKLAKLHEGKKIPKYILESLHVLRPRLVSEQLGSDLKNTSSNEKKLLLFKIMPNITSEKNNAYVHQLEEYLRSEQVKVYDTDMRRLGIVAADASVATAQSVADKSTFIYGINAAPKGLAERIRKRGKTQKALKKSEPIIIATPLTIGPTGDQKGSPTVVVMDSGAENIAELAGIVTRDGYSAFAVFDEGLKFNDGHGTPICYLVAYGENGARVQMKIISYKIYSSQINTVGYAGLVAAINKYSTQSRLFVSSIGYEGIEKHYIARLDAEVQEKNICLVCAAGNICMPQILNHMSNNKPYPLYLKEHKICPPSTGVNIVCVGAIAKKEISKSATSYSIAPISALSPHSRCGNGNAMLFDCKKPEVVEHGGNLNYLSGVLSEKGVGVTGINYLGAQTNSLAGTSFAAPLFMRKLAMIESRWGSSIKNAETLKAIAFMSCTPVIGFSGYGEAAAISGTDRNHALYVTEGIIPLEDKTDKNFKTVSKSETQKMKIPQGIKQIDVCLVHSDNIEKSVEPTLNTYVDVEMRKTGSDSEVNPRAGNPTEKTNVKFLSYKFDTHSMEAQWWLRLAASPTAPLLPDEMKNARVRYGCAVLLSRADDYTNVLSVNQQILAD